MCQFSGGKHDFSWQAQTTPVALLIDDADATVSWSPLKRPGIFTDANFRTSPKGRGRYPKGGIFCGSGKQFFVEAYISRLVEIMIQFAYMVYFFSPNFSWFSGKWRYIFQRVTITIYYGDKLDKPIFHFQWLCEEGVLFFER